MRTVLVTLIGPERTADLVVDADTPVDELLPSLLSAGGVAPSEAQSLEWGVALMGKQPIARQSTLDHAGVLDGSVLVLRRDAAQRADALAAAAAPGEPPGSPLERTRQLLARNAAMQPRRTKLLPTLPEAALSPEGSWPELERAVSSPRLGRCATIAIVSPKGGVGKTTLAIMLGVQLRQLREDTVLALDADSDYGSLGRVAPAVAAGPVARARDDGIFDALAQGSVTFAELDRTLLALPGGLRIVPSPRTPTGMARADRGTYARVIGNLQRLAGVLVIDCGTGLGQPGVQAAILACDQLLLVTDSSGATATLVVEAMRLLERAGRPITIVCNRLRRGRQGSDDLLRLDALFPRASALVGIPDDPEAERALRGELAWASAPRALRQGVLELAAVLALSWPELGLEPAA
jgi:MinD-like ATPase involved in chromosome partitioning or flagellar assembly